MTENNYSDHYEIMATVLMEELERCKNMSAEYVRLRNVFQREPEAVVKINGILIELNIIMGIIHDVIIQRKTRSREIKELHRRGRNSLQSGTGFETAEQASSELCGQE